MKRHAVYGHCVAAVFTACYSQVRSLYYSHARKDQWSSNGPMNALNFGLRISFYFKTDTYVTLLTRPLNLVRILCIDSMVAF